LPRVRGLCGDDSASRDRGDDATIGRSAASIWQRQLSLRPDPECVMLVFLTRPVDSDETSDAEVISLSGARDFAQYLVAIESLLFRMPVGAAVTFIADGTSDRTLRGY
jgi:hypothetical protein